MSKFKDWIIKKLGGYTATAYNESQERNKELIADLKSFINDYNQLYEAHSKLHGLHARLAEEYSDCRDTLAGLQILKTKIETFRAQFTVPKMLRSEKELKREIDSKTQKALTSLYNDLVSQGRFIVVDTIDKGNKFEIHATISVLEGGVIDETQLSQNAGGTGGAQKSNEDSEND